MSRIRFAFTFILLTAFAVAIAQQHDPLRPPNTYAVKSNPHYWKNRKPYADYWQQDVHYTIHARIDEVSDVIEATETLVYTNNSPDELPFVYFHLYQNAFQPGSYYEKMEAAAGRRYSYNPYELNGLGTKVKEIKSAGQDLKTETDNTVMKVFLNKPLKPGESITFDIAFTTYFGLYDGRGGALTNYAMRRRMKRFLSGNFKHYDGVHWYPRISVYDHKFGWTTDQHLGREFYGDYGTYDVELDFANDMVLDATGFLLNRDEVLPPALREKLDIKNFKDKPWNEAPSVITPYDTTQRKVWKFHAENVHDFAFTADPTYRIGEFEYVPEGQRGRKIRCVALAQEAHASRWQNAAEYAAKVVQLYSEDIGMYNYHKMIVADARDGMEYPMLTLDNGGDPGYRGLLCHEIGHNWFFGQVGNNETYRAALDEGFTSWLTAYSLMKLEGDTLPASGAKSKYVRKFKNRDLVLWRRAMQPYIDGAIDGDLATLNTHSDDFSLFPDIGAGYRNVYYKTAAMMFNLEYVLGKDLFMDAMRHYFDQWKFCHPYFEDFRASIINYTKVDLNWFFDQWMETNKTIDYAVSRVKPGIDMDTYVIRFRRKGDMEMPIDFRVVGVDGKIRDFHIPNQWFVKKTDATILPKWSGRGILNQEYEVTISMPGGIQDVIIDPSGRLADVNKLNNTWRFPYTLNYDARIRNASDWDHYELFGRPDVWYNGYDGVKMGFHVNGNYLQKFHRIHASVWLNTGLLQSKLPENIDFGRYDNISWNLQYRTATDKFIPASELALGTSHIDGLNTFTGGFSKRNNRSNTTWHLNGKVMYRVDSTDLTYLIYPEEWGVARDSSEIKFNNTLELGVERSYRYKRGAGSVNAELRSSTFASDYDYAYVRLRAVNHTWIWKTLLRTRVFAQIGLGKNWAPESSLFLAGANPEEMMDNKFVRSIPYYDRRYQGFGDNTKHLHHGGGLNLRGYAGYLVAQLDDNDEVRTVYKGRTGVSLNTELELDKLVRFRPKALSRILGFTPYLFADAGLINMSEQNENFAFADLRADAGLGFALTIKKWPPLEMTEPLTLRLDLPIFLNRTPAVDPEFVQLRYVFGVSRAF
ncbi:MAG: M1 family metallopeptidase [Flavobacteriales bacterium]|nr:M1 family metallopeptidase [Flavobacteriales bacterium]